jgi:hypothetical protein
VKEEGRERAGKGKRKGRKGEERRGGVEEERKRRRGRGEE